MKIVHRIKKTFFTLFLVAGICLLLEPTRGALLPITITPISPPANPTVMGSTLGFYLAGKTYQFDVRVQDPAVSVWADIGTVNIVLKGAQDIDLTVNPAAPAGTFSPVDNNAAANVTSLAEVLAGGTPNDFTVRFSITFRWDTPELVWGGGGLARRITATANSVNPVSTRTDFLDISYGICSTVRLLNTTATLEAADGWVSPYHAAFVVNSNLVYNVPTPTVADAVEALASGEITGSGVEIYYDGAPIGAGIYDTTPAALSFTIPAGTVATPQLAAHNFSARAEMSTPAATFLTTTAASNFTLRCDEVEVTDIEIIGGGGIERTVVANNRIYYRSINALGAQLRVSARMRFAGPAGPVIGATTVRIYDVTEGIVAGDVTIPSGQNTWTVALTYPAGPLADVTASHTYQATALWGGVTDAGQDTYGEIRQPGNVLAGSNTIVFWESFDPPGLPAAGAFMAAPTVVTTANSFTLTWTPLSVLCPGGCNGDWMSPPVGAPVVGGGTYRIYYRQQLTVPWFTVDSTTAGYLAILGNINSTSTDINGLEPLTSYEWYFSAVDIFGNEVLAANRVYGTALTTASGITMTLSDGISKYEDASFTGNPDPVTAHPVRKVNLKVTAKVVTAGNVPDSVYIVLANNTTDMVAQYGTFGGPGGKGTQDDITALPAANRYEYQCLKTGANTWTGYIPDSCPEMQVGNSLRYILKITFKGLPEYEDHFEEPGPPGDWWSQEWRFYVSKAINAQPWPTKILNNVLTKNSPVCYPAYYLTEDANVTIKIYDVLGRPIATLLDGAFRKGGENIKDQGWAGITKAGKKVGPGLYYIHIKAEGLNGNTILNKFNKVAVAW